MRRYQGKADELGIGVRTLRRWVGAHDCAPAAQMVASGTTPGATRDRMALAHLLPGELTAAIGMRSAEP